MRHFRASGDGLCPSVPQGQLTSLCDKHHFPIVQGDGQSCHAGVGEFRRESNPAKLAANEVLDGTRHRADRGGTLQSLRVLRGILPDEGPGTLLCF